MPSSFPKKIRRKITLRRNRKGKKNVVLFSLFLHEVCALFAWLSPLTYLILLAVDQSSREETDARRNLE